jgi:hypothetical protein
MHIRSRSGLWAYRLAICCAPNPRNSPLARIFCSSARGVLADELPFAEGGLTVTERSDKFDHQRRHTRIDSAIPVRISTIEPERDPKTGRPFFRTLQETCANVSRGGIFIKTNESLDPGRRILVEIRLPSGRPLEAIGRIAWVKRVLSPELRGSESGIGIEFLGGASEQLQALDEYVSHRSETPESGRD